MGWSSLRGCFSLRLSRFLSWILVAVLLISVPVMAAAAVIDPYSYQSNVYVDGDNEVVYFSLPDSMLYWRRLHDGSLSNTGSGTAFSYNTQMRYLDNDVVDCYLFGWDNYISTEGVSGDAAFTFSFDYLAGSSGRTQTYDEFQSVLVDIYDSSYNLLTTVTAWSGSNLDVAPNVALRVAVSGSVSGSVLGQGSYFRLRFNIDYADVADESDTTSIEVRLQNYYAAFSIPYSNLYQLQQQGKITNEKLTQIDSQLQENGQTLDQILKQEAANADKLDGIAGDIQDNGNKLDGIQGSLDDTHQMWEDTIHGTVPPQEPDGSGVIDDYETAEDDLWDSVSGGLDDLDSHLSASGGDIASLAVSFAFVAAICNRIWSLPPFMTLLNISLSLGSLAFVLSLGHSFFRKPKSGGGKT